MSLSLALLGTRVYSYHVQHDDRSASDERDPSTLDASVRTAGAGVIIVPSGAALGAEARGVNLRVIDDEAFAAIRRAWIEHQVLLVRGQQLSDDDLIAFSRR